MRTRAHSVPDSVPEEEVGPDEGTPLPSPGLPVTQPDGDAPIGIPKPAPADSPEACAAA